MYCGSLRTYELVFASGADDLQGSDGVEIVLAR